MTQLLRVLTALTEDQSLAPSIHMTYDNPLPSSFKESETLFGLQKAPGTYMMHTYSAKQNTHAHKLKTNRNLKICFVPRENGHKIGNKETVREEKCPLPWESRQPGSALGLSAPCLNAWHFLLR